MVVVRIIRQITWKLRFRRTVLTVLFILLIVTLMSSHAASVELPVLPNHENLAYSLERLGGPYTGASTMGKKGSIPKQFWVTVKDKSGFNERARFMDKHLSWEFRLVDDSDMDMFMTTVFNGTSVLWAYKLLNRKIGAARADIWRYSVMYAYGGVYIDADAGFKRSLDEFIQPSDEFIFAAENNPIRTCYKPEYHLNTTKALFRNKILLQWMFISSPRHAILREILTNVVDIIRNEYAGTSVIDPSLPDKFLWLICSTGPGTFTSSIRNIIGGSAPGSGSGGEHRHIDRDNGSNNKQTTAVAQQQKEAVSYRFAGIDFEQLGGKFKWSGRMWNKDPNHYSHTMKAEKLLIQYAPAKKPPISIY